MPTALRVEAAVPGRRRAGTAAHDLDLDLEPGPRPLAELLDAVVRAEVAAFRARAEAQTFVHVLTERSLAQGVAEGTVRSGGREVPAVVDEQEAVDTALLAHRDGMFEVLVDGEPITDLDRVVDVGPGTALLFLRLVPLAGG